MSGDPMRAASLYLCIVFSLPLPGGNWSSAQTASLPSAPAPQQPALNLPPGAVVLAQPHTPAPPAPDENIFCSVVSDSGEDAIWQGNESLTDAQKSEIKDFVPVLLKQMSREWLRHIPEAATSQFSKGRVALVRFDVNPGGSVSEPIVMMSSGRRSYDQHAINTITKSAPFPLPSDLKDSIHFCVRFEYNWTEPKPKPADPLAPYALPPPKTH